MTDSPPTTSNDPLHGVTLRALLETLLAKHGWEGLADHVNVNCFTFDPSIKSSLKFLRKTPWARAKVEKLYLADIRAEAKRKKRNADRLQRRKLADAAEANGVADAAKANGVADAAQANGVAKAAEASASPWPPLPARGGGER